MILATFCGVAVVGCVGVGFGSSGFVGSAGASVAFAVTEMVIFFLAFWSLFPISKVVWPADFPVTTSFPSPIFAVAILKPTITSTSLPNKPFGFISCVVDSPSVNEIFSNRNKSILSFSFTLLSSKHTKSNFVNPFNAVISLTEVSLKFTLVRFVNFANDIISFNIASLLKSAFLQFTACSTPVRSSMELFMTSISSTFLISFLEMIPSLSASADAPLLFIPLYKS